MLIARVAVPDVVGAVLAGCSDRDTDDAMADVGTQVPAATRVEQPLPTSTTTPTPKPIRRHSLNRVRPMSKWFDAPGFPGVGIAARAWQHPVTFPDRTEPSSEAY